MSFRRGTEHNPPVFSSSPEVAKAEVYMRRPVFEHKISEALDKMCDLEFESTVEFMYKGDTWKLREAVMDGEIVYVLEEV